MKKWWILLGMKYVKSHHAIVSELAESRGLKIKVVEGLQPLVMTRSKV